MNRLIWNIEEDEPMTIKIWNTEADYNLKLPPAASIFVGEAMESAGREAVMQHIAEIDRSPWIRSWHADHTFKLLKR